MDSKKGEGATFNIFLPASEKMIQKEILKGSETVLFVNDADMILDVGRDLLEKLGYEVLTIKSGIEAIEIYRKNQKRLISSFWTWSCRKWVVDTPMKN